VAQLIAAQQPDAEGNVIPRGVQQGSAKFSGPGGPTQPITRNVSAGVFNVQTATCGTVCICCFGIVKIVINPNPMFCPLGTSVQATATAIYSDGSTADVTQGGNWSSSNTAVATVQTQGNPSPGMVYGAGVGTCNIQFNIQAVKDGSQCHNIPVCLAVLLFALGTENTLTVSQSPNLLNMSTGDTKQITVSVSPGSVTATTSFSGTGTPTSNPDSSCAVSLSIPGASGSGSISSNVTAAPAGCSGLFSVVASANGVASGNATTVNVPPQVLIQMMEAEAGGTGNGTLMQALGDVAQNRIHSSLFNPPYSNYQNTVVSGQFALSFTTTGIEPELDSAVGTFVGTSGRFCNGLAFWTPTSTQWQTVQSAINSGTATFPAGTGAPTFSSWSTQNQQILFANTVGTQSNGAPNFLFLAQRSSTQPAAVNASCTP